MPNILIIDDDKTILKILSKILQKEGFNVNTAETGQDALNKLETQQYDAALIDVKLQDVNGIDLLNKIQKIAPSMVKIMLTGYPSEEDRTRALAQGAADYLTKPVKSEKLIEVIESKLEQDLRKPQIQ
ncbi:MAG TPA: response regulator [Candidatus Bathyarchaeia archaeon]